MVSEGSGSMSTRYAIYWAPARGSLLWQAGCRWLGRDPQTQQRLAQPDVPGMPSVQVERLTASARLYGLHATLKPPFQLAPGCKVAELDAVLRELAGHMQPVRPLYLALAPLSGFLALQLAQPNPRLMQVADHCVIALDRFRHPPHEQELAKRRAAGLDARQEALLQQYGYPYVLDRFRFHVTLTDRLTDSDRAVLEPWLRAHFHPALQAPLTLDDICLFVQDAPGAPFRLERRYRVGDAKP
jgi:putative phosphonate metabolism protein